MTKIRRYYNGKRSKFNLSKKINGQIRVMLYCLIMVRLKKVKRAEYSLPIQLKIIKMLLILNFLKKELNNLLNSTKNIYKMNLNRKNNLLSM